MTPIDREGIFKATALNWGVRPSPATQSVAISIEFKILAQLTEEDGWKDWAGYQDYKAFGAFYIIKRDGSINEEPVAQLVESLGWNKDLTETKNPPSDRTVQITIKGEEYKGKQRFKVAWMNPEHFSPQPKFSSNDEVKSLQNRYGSLLRAVPTMINPPQAPPPEPFNQAPAEQHATVYEHEKFLSSVDTLDPSGSITSGSITLKLLDDFKYGNLSDVPIKSRQVFLDVLTKQCNKKGS